MFFIFFFLAAQTSGEAKRPNIIIFIADDVSWDDFGCSGNHDVQTPTIDRLSANGIRFTNVYLTASSCSPCRNSIMTGRYPHNTGAAELHTEPPEEMISFPEVLRNQGYYTAQAGKFHMGTYAERGFDVMFRDREEIGDGGEEDWLKTVQERPREKPFFFWFAALDAHRRWGPNQFSGTHVPAEITPPFYLADGEETRRDLAQYYDEIKRFDYYTGQVISELRSQNILDNTLIIVMADNGRPFPHSKTRVNDRGMKTPFIVHWPAQIKHPGEICEALVSAIDIAPTLMHLAGIDQIPASFQGFNFERLIQDPAGSFREHIFAEHNWHDYEAHERMVRSRDYMYILNSRPLKAQLGPADAIGSPSYNDLKRLEAQGNLSAVQADIFITPRPFEELYDCRLDSLQLLNLAAVPDYQAVLNKMRTILKQWMDETGDGIPGQLTPDWYLPLPGYIKTYQHGVRGEMPGTKGDAVHNNNKSIF